MPEPPENLPAVVAEVWNESLPQLEASGLYEPRDIGIFRIYCELLALLRAGRASQLEVAQLRELGGQLGLTPRNRQRRRPLQEKI